MMTETNKSGFKDTSTECAICLAPLNEGKTIELTCGHRWHLDCLKEQLEHAQPNHARRLLFSGCRCAKCAEFCNHESLNHLTRRTDTLRDQVDALILEQLQIDLPPQVWKSARENISKLVEDGRRTYAFYLCNSCNEPYFGGTVECADQQEGELPSEDRLCPTCAPQLQMQCQHPLEHRGFHVWKCRYCCNPSRYVCYGTVHFCQSCHDRNNARVRQQRRGGTTGPPPLEAIPCPGGDQCPYPKPQGQTHHSNGALHSCEQVYHCVWCLSGESRRNVLEEPGSTNFIRNPSGAQGFTGWQRLSRNMSWQIEPSEIAVNATTSTNFVSSYDWCVMCQRIPLHRLVNDPSSVRIEVSARFMGRTDCPSVFQLEALVLNDRQRTLHRVTTGPLDAPPDFWERASHIIEPVRGAHDVILMVYGKDRRVWRGSYGSKVAECSVRVLCEEAQLDRILRANVPLIQDQPDYKLWLRNHFNVLLPVLLLLLGFFLSSDLMVWV